MTIIVCGLPVSQYASFNWQASVGIAENPDASEYSDGGGIYTDDAIDRKVDSLLREHGDMPVLLRQRGESRPLYRRSDGVWVTNHDSPA